MIFSLENALFFACFFQRPALTVLVANNDSANKPCLTEGLVLCSQGHFRTCMSGRWSVKQDLAQGTNCSIFSPQSMTILSTQIHMGTPSSDLNPQSSKIIPLYGSRPQPDCSVGFGQSAFTDKQLEKLTPFVGEIEDNCTSYLMATWRMYFLFLTCEVKCGAAALNIAGQQNAHSMMLAVRGVVELFKLMKREKELDREILAFSLSHDHRSVRIYGHYALIEEGKTTFY